MDTEFPFGFARSSPRLASPWTTAQEPRPRGRAVDSRAKVLQYCTPKTQDRVY